MKSAHMKSPTKTAYDSLAVVRLGRAEWRVSDAGDANELLGFIERQTAGRFEIVWMSDPIRWGYAETFDSALMAFGDSLRFTGETLPKRARRADESTMEQLSALTHTTAHRSTWVKRTSRSSVA